MFLPSPCVNDLKTKKSINVVYLINYQPKQCLWKDLFHKWYCGLSILFESFCPRSK